MDRRIRKTQNSITTATVELLSTTPINKLTIKEICNKADISRSTFYLHYYDASDVIEQLYNDITMSVSKLFTKFDFANVLSQPKSFLEEIMNFVKQNSQLYELLIINDYHSDFRRRLKNMLQKRIMDENFYRYHNKIAFEYKVCFIISGLVETICDNIQDVSTDKCAQLVETLSQMIVLND
ncbi:MAG: TetR/AcrR family transcriptional regulator [Clostridia bacterium]